MEETVRELQERVAALEKKVEELTINQTRNVEFQISGEKLQGVTARNPLSDELISVSDLCNIVSRANEQKRNRR